uniref:Hcy-binding domain-containing protein n=1 Tax=Parastrongyloides trichosuri TaxID=131310 RepID=A0A0N4Z029_PARTI
MSFCLLDGGLGTTIENVLKKNNGECIDHGFFSFNLCLEKKWLTLANIHMQFLKNYSNCLFTAHYQASIPRLYKKINNLSDIWYLLKICYEIPKIIMQCYGQKDVNNNFPSVVISCGSMGTFFQDKIEYLSKDNHPLYKNNIFQSEIVEEYYKIQIKSLLSISPESIFFETYSLYEEIKILIKILNNLSNYFPTNITFGISICCKNEEFTYGDNNIMEIYTLVKESNIFKYFGINCTHPKYISGILSCLAKNDKEKSLEIVVKCNRGDVLYRDGFPYIEKGAKLFYEYINEWNNILPLAGVGGCCGVMPKDIKELYRRRNSFDNITENQRMVEDEDLKFLIEKVVEDSESFCENKNLGIEIKELDKFFQLMKDKGY